MTQRADDAENDSITGGPSAETIYGGDGNDTIIGGAGSDVLYGEAGSDTFDTHDGFVDTINGGEGEPDLDSMIDFDQTDEIVDVEYL